LPTASLGYLLQKCALICLHDILVRDQLDDLLACDAEQIRLDIVKERLSDILVADRKIWSVISDSINLFLLHPLITHEVFLDAVPHVLLYDTSYTVLSTVWIAMRRQIPVGGKEASSRN
jgi:hypothetical protein